MAPRGLASPLHSLPPILDNESRTPTSSCSKGSRGLSVQPRVFGIFTETTISPDPSLRQRPSRYAIRAGRNFALVLRFRRRRLSLHLGAVARVFHRRSRRCMPRVTRDYSKGRRLIASIDYPHKGGWNTISRPKRTISRYGVKLRRVDFPRDYPFASRRP